MRGSRSRKTSITPEKIIRKSPSNTKAWTSDEEKRLRKLIISNASVLDIADDLGRTVKAVRARAHALRIALGRSRFRIKANPRK